MQLIQMRQRIKAIETIEKITHAMRLISMSLHGRLKNKELFLERYKDGTNALFASVLKKAPDWINPLEHNQDPQSTLIILIGSNKGLTGNFNTNLFKFYEKQAPESRTAHIIALGKKAVDYAKNNALETRLQFTNVSYATLFDIAQQISDYMFAQERKYGSIVIISNTIKNFFVQKPARTQLVPFVDDAASVTQEPFDYMWEQSPQEILTTLNQMRVKAELQYLIFESLLAEQAARFVSMDSSTRNAANLLEETKLQYNKLRQAKITKELTELTASF